MEKYSIGNNVVKKTVPLRHADAKGKRIAPTHSDLGARWG
jgi:hypothetical protein